MKGGVLTAKTWRLLFPKHCCQTGPSEQKKWRCKLSWLSPEGNDLGYGKTRGIWNQFPIHFKTPQFEEGKQVVVRTGRNTSIGTPSAFTFASKAWSFQVISNTMSPCSTATSNADTQEIAESWLPIKITLKVSAGVNWRSRPCRFPHVKGEERYKLQLPFNYFFSQVLGVSSLQML